MNLKANTQLKEGITEMPQQKGFKRAIKVANRKRKLVIRKKEANLKRTVRQAELAAKEPEQETASS